MARFIMTAMLELEAASFQEAQKQWFNQLLALGEEVATDGMDRWDGKPGSFHTSPKTGIQMRGIDKSSLTPRGAAKPASDGATTATTGKAKADAPVSAESGDDRPTEEKTENLPEGVGRASDGKFTSAETEGAVGSDEDTGATAEATDETIANATTTEAPAGDSGNTTAAEIAETAHEAIDSLVGKAEAGEQMQPAGETK